MALRRAASSKVSVKATAIFTVIDGGTARPV